MQLISANLPVHPVEDRQDPIAGAPKKQSQSRGLQSTLCCFHKIPLQIRSPRVTWPKRSAGFRRRFYVRWRNQVATPAFRKALNSLTRVTRDARENAELRGACTCHSHGHTRRTICPTVTLAAPRKSRATNWERSVSYRGLARTLYSFQKTVVQFSYLLKVSRLKSVRVKKVGKNDKEN